MTNEGSIQGAVSFPNTSGELGSTASTFANDTGGDIGTGGTVEMDTGTTFIQNSGTMSGGFAEVADASLDIAGSGAAHFLAFSNVSMTGDIHPGQELDILGQSWSSGAPCGSPVDATVNATGSFTNGGTIVLRSTGSTFCPPGNATLTVPAGDVDHQPGHHQRLAVQRARGADDLGDRGQRRRDDQCRPRHHTGDRPGLGGQRGNRAAEREAGRHRRIHTGSCRDHQRRGRLEVRLRLGVRDRRRIAGRDAGPGRGRDHATGGQLRHAGLGGLGHRDLRHGDRHRRR